MEIKDNKIFLGGVSAEELVSEFGDPLYVYEEDKIRSNYKKLFDCISYSPKKILYACKANTNLSVMRILRDIGSGIDAVSTGEIYLAQKAGFRSEDILFTGNNMTDGQMRYAHEQGVLLNIGSVSRLEKFGQAFSGSDVCIRVNPDIKPDVHPHLATGGIDSKFGIYMGHKDKVTKIAEKYDLNICGIHAHIGTTIMDLAPFSETMDVVLAAAAEFDSIDFVDFGGGIGIPYKPKQKEVDLSEFGSSATEKMRAFSDSYGKKVEYRIEPGRYLVAQSGFLLSEVNTVKQNPKKTFIGLGTSMSHLVRPAMYDAYHHIYNASKVEGETQKYDVVGNVCETGDFLGRDRDLPKTKEGDILAITDAGAYGYAMASNYNSFFKPAEVLVSSGKAKLIRKRECFEDLERGQ